MQASASKATKKTAAIFSACHAFLAKDARLYLSYRYVVIFNIVSILFAVATYFFMGRSLEVHLAAYNGNYFGFLLLGIATSTLVMTVSNGLLSALHQEMQSGTLEILLASPHYALTILLAISGWNVLLGFLSAVVYLILGVVCFNLTIYWQQLPMVGVSLLLALSVYFALGLLAACILLKIKRGNPLQWLLSSVQVLLGGIYFPVQHLPHSLQLLAKCLPLTHATEMTRALLLPPKAWQPPIESFTYLIVLALCLWPVAIFQVQRTIRSIAQHGSFASH